MTTNLFVVVNVKQLRTKVVLDFYCLFYEHLGVLASEIQLFLNKLGCWNRNTKYFPLNLQSGSTLSKLLKFGGGEWGGTQQTAPLLATDLCEIVNLLDAK
jgi:hypothetical protein